MKKILANIIVFALIAGVITWIGLFTYGFIHALWENSTDYPGKAAFEVENQKIFVFKDTQAFGNSPEAIALANNFSIQLKEKCKSAFTGGSRITPATAGNFLTYCQLTPTKLVILCQVPDLRGYDGNVREALAQLAWATAQEAAAAQKLNQNMTLAVGLRGFASYGPVWEGKAGGAAATKGDGPDEEKRLYPYFIHADQ